MLRSPAMALHSDFAHLARPQIALPKDAPATGVFALTHRVGVEETSALVPHANNIVILGWIDLVASRHGDACGASREELAASGRMWFVARHELDYLGESFVGDEVHLVTWIEKLGRTSLSRATRVVRARDRLELVRATSRWALVDLATRKPTPIAESVRAKLME